MADEEMIEKTVTEEVAAVEDSWTIEYHPPQLVGFVACEDVVNTVRGGEEVNSLQRITYTLQSTACPAVFQRVTFAHLWVGGDEGIAYQVTLRLLDPADDEIARHGSALVGAPSSIHPALIVTFFNALRLEGPGQYRVELLLDDVRLFECPLTVVGPPVEMPMEAGEPVSRVDVMPESDTGED